MTSTTLPRPPPRGASGWFADRPVAVKIGAPCSSSRSSPSPVGCSPPLVKMSAMAANSADIYGQNLLPIASPSAAGRARAQRGQGRRYGAVRPQHGPPEPKQPERHRNLAGRRRRAGQGIRRLHRRRRHDRSREAGGRVQRRHRRHTAPCATAPRCGRHGRRPRRTTRRTPTPRTPSDAAAAAAQGALTIETQAPQQSARRRRQRRLDGTTHRHRAARSPAWSPASAAVTPWPA